MKIHHLIISAVIVIGTILMISFSGFTTTQEVEHEKIEAAILDYVEGLYEVDTTRIYRSVHPELKKRGYYYTGEEKGYTGKLEMSFEQLVKLTANWNKDGKNANADSPRGIKIYEVYDKTASARVTAEWGVDFFHLAKIDGQWVIMNVLWQSPPR